MNKISCEMCMDLMPLVHDGVASSDSRNAVLAHIETCPDCKSLFEGELPAPAKDKSILKKLQNQMRLFSAMVMMFGIFYGLMLTAGNGLFLNVVIMPVIGGIAYYLFRWKALVLVPPLLLATHCVTNALGLGGEYLDLIQLLLWTAIYCGFALVGFVIAALLHFVFRKEEEK